MPSPELAVIGLTCILAGVFFLANSIILRRTRKVIEEFFRVGAGTLAQIKDYALHKIQVVIGFLFLTAGFILQVFAWLPALEERATTLAVCAGIVAVAVTVYAFGSVYSRRHFRRYLVDFFRAHPAWSFTENMALTKEIGLFLGIRHTKDMTVEEFIRQVKEALGVPPAAAGLERPRRVREISALREQHG